MSRAMRKCVLRHMRTTKALIRLHICAFVVCCLDSIISLDSIAEISRLLRLRRPVCVWPGWKLPKTHFVMSQLKYISSNVLKTSIFSQVWAQVKMLTFSTRSMKYFCIYRKKKVNFLFSRIMPFIMLQWKYKLYHSLVNWYDIISLLKISFLFTWVYTDFTTKYKIKCHDKVCSHSSMDIWKKSEQFENLTLMWLGIYTLTIAVLHFLWHKKPSFWIDLLFVFFRKNNVKCNRIPQDWTKVHKNL